MSSLTMFPERPTLPPLRSLDLPMHGVPSRMTLPSIHELCNQSDDLVRLLYVRVNVTVVPDAIGLITGPVAPHRILCLAMETSGICFFSNLFMFPFHSNLIRRSSIPYIYGT